MSGLLLIAMVTTPALTAVVTLLIGGVRPRLAARAGALTAGVGFAIAVGLGVQATRGDVVSASIGGLDLSADQLAAVLLPLVFGVSAIVQSFAMRYLAGDSRATWFTAGAGALTAASAGLVTATTLVGMAVAWSLAGAALCLLLATYWHIPSARDGVRRTATAFLLGDLALWGAVALATTQWGAVELRGLEPAAPTGPLAPVVACLIVLAALSRSAQIPFHRWLPATLAAPTPVSALLHAGVVNAGGILLVRLGALVSGDLARGLLILAGAVTMVYGAVIMLVKPDVKGALAHSTMSQMGFMILTCGLGLWGAAVFHLVAHGFYKATLFLSSGSAIAHHRRLASRPPMAAIARRTTARLALTAMTLPAVALSLAAMVVRLPTGDHASGAHALIVFAWASGSAVTWGWLRRRPGIDGVLIAAAVLLPVSAGYLAMIAAVTSFLRPALPVTTAAATVTWLVVIVVAGFLGALATLRWAPRTSRVHHALYARALSAGHITPSPSRRPTGAHS